MSLRPLTNRAHLIFRTALAQTIQETTTRDAPGAHDIVLLPLRAMQSAHSFLFPPNVRILYVPPRLGSCRANWSGLVLVGLGLVIVAWVG